MPASAGGHEQDERSARALARRRCRGAGVELRVVPQDRLLEPLELLARLEPELLGQLAPRAWYASSASAWRPER